ALADNIAAWRRLRLAPRMLRDVTAIDTSVSVLGARIAAPLMVAPTGRHKLFHPDGERATARGAAAAGVPYVMATAATVSMEDVAAERTSAPQWFQLYLPPDRRVTEGLVDRAAAAGFSAVVLTVDQPVYGSSPRPARAIARYSRRHPAGPAGGGARLRRRTQWKRDASGDLRRSRLAGAALSPAAAGQGRAARRRRRALRRARRQGRHRLQPWRPPPRRHRRDRRRAARDRRRARRQSRSLRRGRHPPRPHCGESAGAGRPRGGA